jgi:hypothetical protein
MQIVCSDDYAGPKESYNVTICLHQREQYDKPCGPTVDVKKLTHPLASIIDLGPCFGSLRHFKLIANYSQHSLDVRLCTARSAELSS